MCFVSGTFANRKWLLLGHHVASYWLIVAFRLLFDCHNVAGCLCLDANDDVSVARTFDWHLCVRLAPLSNLRPANCGSNSTGVTTCLLSISNTEKKIRNSNRFITGRDLFQVAASFAWHSAFFKFATCVLSFNEAKAKEKAFVECCHCSVGFKLAAIMQPATLQVRAKPNGFG